jgi:hypothetical protein
MPLPVPLAVTVPQTPVMLLAAAQPLPRDAFVPYIPPMAPAADPASGGFGPVETFDPLARAELISRSMPRYWRGTYRSFGSSKSVPIVLEISSATAQGQMVDLRGRMAIDGVQTPVQGNLNAKSDQLDLLLLADRLGGGLESGGEFQGLQGFSLSGWEAPRLTSMGGRLQLQPDGSARVSSPAQSGTVIRGLW